MKILMVSGRFAPLAGGVERHLSGVCAELQAMGHHIDVLTFGGTDPKTGKALPKQSTEGGVRVFRLKATGPSRVGQLQAAAWALQHRRLLRSYDIIHGHDIVLKALQRFAPGARRYLTFHGFESYPVTAESRERKLAMQAQVQGAMCAGSFIERWFGVKCDVVEWGAFTPPATTSPIASDYCFIGRLAEDTGCEAYVSALASHLKKHSEKTAIICGDGPLRSRLEKMVAGMPVTFPGMVGNPSDYVAGTGVVLTSGYLGMLEAMYAEKPVVAYAGNPLKEDYLRSAPYASDIFIATSLPELEAHLQDAASQTESAIKRCREFAESATYPALATLYVQLWSTY